MKKKTIVGIIGSPGSGKETVAKLIAEKFSDKVHHVTFSGPLTSFLLDMGFKKEDIDRPTLQLLAQKLNQHFGDGTVTRGALLLIKNSTTPIDIVDGVRWVTDFDELKSLENQSTKCLMVYVRADSKTRFERIRARRQRAGEKELTEHEFYTQDNAPNEQFISTLGDKADICIDNDKDDEKLKSLREQIDTFCERFLS